MTSTTARADAMYTYTFDEIAEAQLDPSVSVLGTRFTYLADFPDAFYNAAAAEFGPGDATLLSGGVLDGDTLGALEMRFRFGTQSIELALAFATDEPTTSLALLSLYDMDDNLISSSNIATAVLLPGGFSEGSVSFASAALIKRAVLSFDSVGAESISRFAIDHLRVASQVVPEPGTGALALLGIGSIVVLGRWKRRRVSLRAS
jgi:hypothetical protein